MRTLLNFMMMMVFITGSLFVLSQPVAAETVTVQVRSIAASTQGTSFDPQLSDLKSNLDKGFANYTNFKQVGSTSFKLGDKASNTTKLASGDDLTMTFHGRAGDFVKLGLAIGSRLNTSLRVKPGSTFFQAGLNYQNGILILAITLR